MSHYYFERYAAYSEQVLGGLLPDLLKNVDKTYSFPLHKFQSSFPLGPKSESLTEGWRRHLEVDKLFHSSDFFYHHTHEIRKVIEKGIEDLPIRASFLAHISLELLLDHKLIANNLLSVGRLYEHLEHVDRNQLTNYLKSFESIDIERFFNFYDKFVASKYIFDYAKVDNIPHALFNICKRVWNFTPKTHHFEVLAQQLDNYQREQLRDYADIYAYIMQQLD
ncbi:hypothetical protein IPZ78_08210 [Sphingobacterium sp. WQ 366]|uniref:Acyl carrier protein phosphodiesterase n=1 Tax=Sphingobacterium bovistauri TaxID=2781959 RepID=A0ABS7Z542_9SPHI|nr:hypothetical protein [Sphingobacterium bovistauri]